MPATPGTAMVPFTRRLPARLPARVPTGAYGDDVGDGGDPVALGNRFGAQLQGQVDAYTAGAREDLTRDAGSMLGNLNAIGALRSGAVQTGLSDLTGRFATNVGREAASTATAAAGLGLDAWREQHRTDENARDFTYQTGRAARSDFESDRGFTADQAQRDRAYGFQEREADRAYTNQALDRTQRQTQIDNQAGQFSTNQAFEASRAAAADASHTADRTEQGRQFDQNLNFERTTYNQGRKDANTATWGRVAGQAADAYLNRGKKAAGGAGGAVGGAAGAALGTAVLPGVGTMVGGFLGKVAGSTIGKGIVGGARKLFHW